MIAPLTTQWSSYKEQHIKIELVFRPGCGCDQRDSAQGQAERRIGKVLLEMLVVLVFNIEREERLVCLVSSGG